MSLLEPLAVNSACAGRGGRGRGGRGSTSPPPTPSFFPSDFWKLTSSFSSHLEERIMRTFDMLGPPQAQLWERWTSSSFLFEERTKPEGVWHWASPTLTPFQPAQPISAGGPSPATLLRAPPSPSNPRGGFHLPEQIQLQAGATAPQQEELQATWASKVCRLFGRPCGPPHGPWAGTKSSARSSERSSGPRPPWSQS